MAARIRWRGPSALFAVARAFLVENVHASHVGGVGFFVRVSDREHAELAKLRKRADQVEDDAFLGRGVEMQAFRCGDIDKVRWRQPAIVLLVQIIGRVVGAGLAGRRKKRPVFGS